MSDARVADLREGLIQLQAAIELLLSQGGMDGEAADLLRGRVAALLRDDALSPDPKIEAEGRAVPHVVTKEALAQQVYRDGYALQKAVPPVAPVEPDIGALDDFLESEAFEGMMYAYRMAPRYQLARVNAAYDQVIAAIQAASRAARAPATCESDCNPFTASCGAKFCTYEDMAHHETTTHRELPNTPPSAGAVARGPEASTVGPRATSDLSSSADDT